jgi:hypothetical protein
VVFLGSYWLSEDLAPFLVCITVFPLPQLLVSQLPILRAGLVFFSGDIPTIHSSIQSSNAESRRSKHSKYNLQDRKKEAKVVSLGFFTA